VLAVALGLLAASPAYALDQAEYAKLYHPKTGDEGDQAALQRCIAAWGDSPFGKAPYKARFIEAKVRVMGAGHEIDDDVATTWPQLIFVKPAVNVMTKTTVKLRNPNGWYCLEANVTVMGKLVIQAACDAHLADSRSGATVIGSNSSDGGVTVMGSTQVVRDSNCHAAPEAAAAPAPAPKPADPAATRANLSKAASDNEAKHEQEDDGD